MKFLRFTIFCVLPVILIISVFPQGRVVDVEISLNGGQNTVLISPDPVEIEVGERLRWRSSGEQGDVIDIEIDQQDGVRGPFPPRNDSENPSRGRYTKNVGSPIVTEAASDQGSWKYTVVWIRGDGRRIPLDPRIIVR